MDDLYLPLNENRKYELKLENGFFSISGDYWQYNVSDIYRKKNSFDQVDASEYLGIGKLRMRPVRYVVTFIMFPIVIGIVTKAANHWIFRVILSSEALDKMSGVVNSVINILMAMFVLYGIRLVFSIKDLVEISFISKHICIPRKSLTDTQYRVLDQSLKSCQRPHL